MIGTVARPGASSRPRWIFRNRRYSGHEAMWSSEGEAAGRSTRANRDSGFHRYPGESRVYSSRNACSIIAARPLAAEEGLATLMVVSPFQCSAGQNVYINLSFAW